MSGYIFNKCERGYLFRENSHHDGFGYFKTFAFDTVEDAAAWLIEQYTPKPEEPVCTCKTKG